MVGRLVKRVWSGSQQLRKSRTLTEELERLLYLRVLRSVGTRPRRVAQDLSLNEWHRRLLFVMDQ